MTEPKPPADLGREGKAAWRRLVDPRMEFRADELLLLAEACRVVDTLARIRRRKSPDPKETRLQQEQLRKLLTAVRWPEEHQGENLSQWGRTLAARRWG